MWMFQLSSTSAKGLHTLEENETDKNPQSKNDHPVQTTQTIENTRNEEHDPDRQYRYMVGCNSNPNRQHQHMLRCNPAKKHVTGKTRPFFLFFSKTHQQARTGRRKECTEIDRYKMKRTEIQRKKNKHE